jgi:hypothetical protein
MAIHHPITQSGSRNGISLIEVLIAMFVLAVGILSVFGLFAAGREMEARTILLQKAKAFADGPGLAQVNGWMSVGQWLRYDNEWRWVHSTATRDPSTFQVQLPVMIDPISLALGDNGSPSTSGAMPWDWNRVAALPFVAPGSASFALQRVSLASTERARTPETPTSDVIAPFNRNAVFENAGDPDDVRFGLDTANSDNPPLNLFALGRRARNSDLVPALFLANQTPSGDITAVNVRRWILIHHNPFLGYETFSNSTARWPAGSLRFRVNVVTVSATTSGTIPITANSVLSLSLDSVPDMSGNPVTPQLDDDSAVRRSMKPGRWLLLARQTTAVSGQYDIAWVEMKSVTPQPSTDPPSWLVLLDTQSQLADGSWTPNLTRCFAFESIIYVKRLADAPLSVP